MSHINHVQRLGCLWFPPSQDRRLIYKQMSFTRFLECADCPWNYIRETGRCLQTGKKEHIRNMKTYEKDSNIATQTWLNGHCIDFNNAHVIDKENFHVRRTLESWNTAVTIESGSNSKPLPRQYSILYEPFISILLAS